MIRALLAVAALATTAPAAMAQVAPPAEAAAEVAAPGEAEFEATAQAFGVRMQAMGQEMQAAVASAGGDAAKQDADLDVIEARYQPDVDGFVSALEAFVAQQAAASPGAESAEMTTGLAAALPQIRSIPQQVRTQIEEAAAPAAATSPTS